MPEKDSSTRNPASPSAWKNGKTKKKPARLQRAVTPNVRQLESCRLARTELQRQLEVSTHQIRKQQLGQAIAELERRISQLSR